MSTVLFAIQDVIKNGESILKYSKDSRLLDYIYDLKKFISPRNTDWNEDSTNQLLIDLLRFQVTKSRSIRSNWPLVSYVINWFTKINAILIDNLKKTGLHRKAYETLLDEALPPESKKLNLGYLDQQQQEVISFLALLYKIQQSSGLCSNIFDKISVDIIDLLFLIFKNNQVKPYSPNIEIFIKFCIIDSYVEMDILKNFIEFSSIGMLTPENLRLYINCYPGKRLLIRDLLFSRENFYEKFLALMQGKSDVFEFLLKSDHPFLEKLKSIFARFKDKMNVNLFAALMYLAQYYPQHIEIIYQYIIKKDFMLDELFAFSGGEIGAEIETLLNKIGTDFLMQGKVNLENSLNNLEFDSMLKLVTLMKSSFVTLNFAHHYLAQVQFEKVYQVICADGTLQTMKDFLPTILAIMLDENNLINPRAFAIAQNLAREIYHHDKNFPEANLLQGGVDCVSDMEEVNEEFISQMHQPLRSSVLMTDYTLPHLINLGFLHGKKNNSAADQEAFDIEFGMVVRRN